MQNPYDERYAQDGYYWGTRPSRMAYEVLQRMPPDAERLRGAVQERSFSRRKRLTVSIGISSYADDGETEEALLLSVDHALYEAKRMGRNRSCVYRASLPGIPSAVSEAISPEERAAGEPRCSPRRSEDSLARLREVLPTEHGIQDRAA